ncbi:MAG: ATP-binding protein [Acinetobacter sp.]
MVQWLPRGLELPYNNRIKTISTCGESWQIFVDNNNAYVLAVDIILYRKWVCDYSLPEGLFFEQEGYSDYRLLCSSGKYMISSLDNGPYPDCKGQVEAFSLSINTVNKLFPCMNWRDAIYIEEYSLIFPTHFDDDSNENDLIFGKWLTGGIKISVKSTSRLSRIMSWLPKDELCYFIETAGFKADCSETEDAILGDYLNVKGEQAKNTQKTEGRFTLVGRPCLETFFNENIIDIVRNQDAYKKMGILFPGATILYGPPGCGKTYAVERLVEYLGWKRFDIDSTSIASSFIHDTSKKISEVFNAAIKAAPSVIVIDEMEAFLSDRSIPSAGGIHHVEEVAEFLRKIPEAISKGVLVFAMTNMKDVIDPAILRRGRFDNIVKVDMATQEEIAALLSDKFSELPIHENVDIDRIAKELNGHPMSDITFVIKEAGRFAVKNNLKQIDFSCFTSAFALLPKEDETKKIGFGL